VGHPTNASNHCCTSGNDEKWASREAQVDEAAELWGISDRELKEIRRSLEELG